jgi:tetratricopeptide (TPR) repeat protein
LSVVLWPSGRRQRAEHEAKRSAAAFDELRESAPAFAEQARGLAAREQYDDAVAKLDYAIKLRPDVAEYFVAKGDLLQCQRKLAEAAEIYREALRVKPGLARAEASAKLCDELLAAPLSEQESSPAKASRSFTSRCRSSSGPRQNCAGSAIARRREEAPRRVLARSAQRAPGFHGAAAQGPPHRPRRWPARARSQRHESRRSIAAGRGASRGADLSGTKDQSELSDLAPLRGLALIELIISNTSVADLSPLREMHTLEKLEMSGSKVTDLSHLSELRLKSLSFLGCAVSNLAPIRKMPLED